MAEPAESVAQWLPAARSGSREALGRVLEACRGYLLAVARRELDPDLQAKGSASDLVQQTFLEAQQSFARFQGDSDAELLAWLRCILLNNLANFTRQFRATDKRQVDREVGLGGKGSSADWEAALAAGRSTPSGRAIGSEQEEALERALRRLSEDYRQVIALRYQEQCSFEEIASRMGRSEAAARKLWARAVHRLRLELEVPP
jgi:RNA polymerase sigma-70 factor (ECF subfamily)